MLEMWVWFLGWEYPLEEEMATHSTILARKIPQTEEPGELQSMGSQGIGRLSVHDWAWIAIYPIANLWISVIIISNFYKRKLSHRKIKQFSL